MLGYRAHGKAFIGIVLVDVVQRRLNLLLLVASGGMAGGLGPESGQLGLQLLPVEAFPKLLIGFAPQQGVFGDASPACLKQGNTQVHQLVEGMLKMEAAGLVQKLLGQGEEALLLPGAHRV